VLRDPFGTGRSRDAVPSALSFFGDKNAVLAQRAEGAQVFKPSRISYLRSFVTGPEPIPEPVWHGLVSDVFKDALQRVQRGIAVPPFQDSLAGSGGQGRASRAAGQDWRCEAAPGGAERRALLEGVAFRPRPRECAGGRAAPLAGLGKCGIGFQPVTGRASSPCGIVPAGNE
jgi:hypothetical protein